MTPVRGVVEGFYGRPYAPRQRRALLGLLSSLDGSAYLYAPKNDPWHRRLWREPYPKGAWDSLADLFEAGVSRGVDVIFGVSPVAAGPAEAASVRKKLSRAVDAGARGVAVLFDDQIDLADEALAGRHLRLARKAAEGLGVPVTVCPAVYCTELEEQMRGSGYIRLFSRECPDDWNLMWTGRSVVSRRLDGPDLSVPALKRPPAVWDNLLADDYCLRRIYLAPLRGRVPYGCDYFLNPSSIFPVALHAVRELALACGQEVGWPRELGCARDGWHYLRLFFHTPWELTEKASGMVRELGMALRGRASQPVWLVGALDGLEHLVEELPDLDGGFDLLPYAVDLRRMLSIASRAIPAGEGSPARLRQMLLERLPFEHPIAAALKEIAEETTERHEG